MRSLSRLNIIPSLPHHLCFVFFFFNKGKTKQKILSPYAADSRKLDCIHPSGSNTKDLLGYFKQMWSLRTAQKASQQCDFFFFNIIPEHFLNAQYPVLICFLGPICSRSLLPAKWPSVLHQLLRWIWGERNTMLLKNYLTEWKDRSVMSFLIFTTLFMKDLVTV